MHEKYILWLPKVPKEKRSLKMIYFAEKKKLNLSIKQGQKNQKKKNLSPPDNERVSLVPPVFFVFTFLFFFG